METKMNINSTELNELPTPTVTSEAVEHAGTVSPKTGGQIRRYLSAGWHFTRHLLEMVVAMIAGMATLMIYRWDRYAHGAHGHHKER